MQPNKRQKKSQKKNRKRVTLTGPPPWTAGDQFLPITGPHGLEGYSRLTARTLRDFTALPVDPLPCYRPNGTGPAKPGRRGAKILVRLSEFNAWMARRRQREQAPPKDVGGILEQAKREVLGR